MTEHQYSREAFDDADQELNQSLDEIHREIHNDPRGILKRGPSDGSSSQRRYLRAAHARYDLVDQAEAEARRLEGRHQELVKALEDARTSGNDLRVREAEQYLFLFEKNELDMHGGLEIQ